MFDPVRPVQAGRMNDFIGAAGTMVRHAASAAMGSIVGLFAAREEAARRGVILRDEDENIAKLAGLWAAGFTSTMGQVDVGDQSVFEQLAAAVTQSLKPFGVSMQCEDWIVVAAIGANATAAIPLSSASAPQGSTKVARTARPTRPKKRRS